MLDDEINKRIQEAADQYHPAYDDKAWGRMEQMLEEHLPQKKDRRRIIFFLLFAAIISAGLLVIFYPHEKNLSSAASNTIAKNRPGNDRKTIELVPHELPDNNDNTNVIATAPGNEANNPKQQSSIASHKTILNVNNESGINKTIYGDRNIKDNQAGKNTIDNKTTEANTMNNQDNLPKPDITNNNTSPAPVSHDSNNKITEANGQDTTKKETSVKPKDSSHAKSADKRSRRDKRFANNFAINASAGPDISGVTISQIGKITLAYGLGFSYDLSKKFTLRTGFYITQKIYSADESDYHSNIVNYNYLQSIDANCKVYEIPLVVNYNFGKVKNHSWFATAGLSSYLMKKEDYVYYYKYPSGNTYDKYWSVSNENKNYFSVIDLSAGYQYMVNKRISLAAEPYLRLPLSGIGAGKIKLNSGGILFSVSIKPFKK